MPVHHRHLDVPRLVAVANHVQLRCTRHLKLDVTRNFLKDWLASKATVPRLGHYGHGSRMDPEEAYRRLSRARA